MSARTALSKPPAPPLSAPPLSADPLFPDRSLQNIRAPLSPPLSAAPPPGYTPCSRRVCKHAHTPSCLHTVLRVCKPAVVPEVAGARRQRAEPLSPHRPRPPCWHPPCNITPDNILWCCLVSELCHPNFPRHPCRPPCQPTMHQTAGNLSKQHPTTYKVAPPLSAPPLSAPPL